jgi:hypothetical protein
MSNAPRLCQCPACGAALEIRAGQKILKCTYCKSSVIVPGEGDLAASRGIPDEAISIKKVVELVRSGKKIEAIRVFRETTLASLAEAKDVVDAIEHGEAIDITSFLSPETSREPSWDARDAAVRSRPGKTIAITLAVSALLLVAGMIGIFVLQKQQKGGAASKPFTNLVSKPLAKLVSKPFADPVLTFGKKGTGPGMLNDPRHVGVDRDGNIYAADYGDGRINVFDATGKFQRLVSLGKKTYIQGMSAAPDGTLYLSYEGKIHRLGVQGSDTLLSHKDESGHPIHFTSIALGADGSLVAAGHGERIVRFGPGGKVNLVIAQAFTSVTGDSELKIQLAVDGLGNIYALGAFNTLVFKYSPDGKYLDQFGGKTENPARGVDKGRFQAPDAIAVDGHGRVYVSDIWGIQVFDANGRFLEFFKVDGVAFGMAFDLNNDLYIASNKPAVIKLRIQAP